MSKSLTSYIKYFIIFIAVLFFLFPIYWMFITTMKPQLEVMYYPPLFIPPEFTIKYYIEAFYWLGGEAFKNSLIITTCTTSIATVLTSSSLPLGNAFALRLAIVLPRD